MGLFEIILTAIVLSIDALAVSICKGLSMKKVKASFAFIIALFFGAFQAIMPVIGWLLGTNFQKYIEAFDHWIAFALLAFLGIKMLKDAFSEKEDKCEVCESQKIDFKELTLMAIATSIDAMAVGIAMAMLPSDSINIFSAVSIIGIITFIICLAGVFLGNKVGETFEKNATFAGGIILILLGAKIPLEHLGILDRIFSLI